VIDLLATDPFYGGWGNTRFMNTAFVAPPSGVLPPVIMGGILNYKTQPLTWTFMAYDPADRTSDYGLDSLFSDGVNVSVAATWDGDLAGRTSSINLNGIYSSAEKPDLRDYLLPEGVETRTHGGSWHFSAKVTHLLIESRDQPGKGLGFYAKAGVSDGNPNPIERFFSGGVTGQGMVAGRPDDVFGLGYFYYNFSNDLQGATAGAINFDNEQGIELFYNWAVTPWLRISPDLQWIDPANGDNDQAWVGTVRVNVTF
jgi:porin